MQIILNVLSPYDMSLTTQLLNIKIGKFRMGRNVLYEHLRLLDILEYRGKVNYPKNEFFKLGIFLQVPVLKENNKIYFKTCVTKKGIQWLKQTQVEKIIQAEIKYWEKYYPKYLYILKE